MRHLPPYRLLASFDAICRMGSVKNAASSLNVTPPAISQAVKALEREVGVILLDRRVRPAVLTEAGHRLSYAIRNGFGMIEEAIEDIQHEAGISAQRLDVSCTLGMATHWLMPKLSGFYARHPEMVVNIQAPPSETPELSPGVDIALRYGKGEWRDGKTFKLFDERVCPVGAPNVIEAALTKGGLEEAALIDVRPGIGSSWAIWKDYLLWGGIVHRSGPTHIFDNYVQAVQTAIEGRGIMLGWRSITQKLVSDGVLLPWPDGEKDLETAYYITLAPSSVHKEAANAFLHWLIEAGHSAFPPEEER